MQTITIDRFEEEYAICENEDQTMVTIPRETLPDDAREGDLLTLQDGIFHLDTEATEARRRRIRKKMMDLYE